MAQQTEGSKSNTTKLTKANNLKDKWQKHIKQT